MIIIISIKCEPIRAHRVLSWSWACAPMAGNTITLHAYWRPVALSFASFTTEKPGIEQRMLMVEDLYEWR